MAYFLAEFEGEYYRGSVANLRLIDTMPLLLPIKSVDDPSARDGFFFYEEYFDATTRTRRGRLFRCSQNNRWNQSRMTPSPIFESSVVTVNNAYESAFSADFSTGAHVSLGDAGGPTRWTVVLNERGIFGESVLTLKSTTYLGVLPEVRWDAIPESNRQEIRSVLDAVVTTASTQAPQPVIDACRNAVSLLISIGFQESNPDGKKDLGKLVNWLIEHGKLKKCTDTAASLLYLMEASVSHLTNQLHNRSKANASAKHGTRPVSQYDASLAVNCVAFLLQDLGWAVNE